MRKINTFWFFDFLRIPSYFPEGKAVCAEFLKCSLMDLGFDSKVFSDFTSPIIFAKMRNESSENVLFYLHYDVKAPGDINQWRTPPFEPFLASDNRIYARGAGDDKGQIFSLFKAIERIQQNNCKIKPNVYILIEGDEESGSPDLSYFCKQYVPKINFDAVFVLDSHWQKDEPIIYCGTRGQLSIEIKTEVVGYAENLHAGNYGGVVNGAADQIVQILHRLLSGFHKLFVSDPIIKANDSNCISVTYLNSGIHERSLIPINAEAKLDIRFIESSVPKQFLKYLHFLSKEMDFSYNVLQNENCYYNEPNIEYIQSLKSAFYSRYGMDIVLSAFCGAYIPMEKLCSVSGIKYVLPVAQSDEHNHAPNENISMFNIEYGTNIVEQILT